MFSSFILIKAIFTLLLPPLYPKSDSSSISERKRGKSTKMHRMPSTWGCSCLLSLGLLHVQSWNLNCRFNVLIRASFTNLRPSQMAISSIFASSAVSVAASSSFSLLIVAVTAAACNLWASVRSIRSFSNVDELPLIESLITLIADCAFVIFFL